MSEGCWDHTKPIGEVVGSMLGQRKSLKPIKTIFPWRDTKGGRNSLGRRSTRVKIIKMKGMSEVE
jgi:hypothetical protein